MSNVRRPCLTHGCTNDALRGARRSRCASCQRRWDRERNARPERAAYRDPVYLAQPKHGVCYLCGEPGADTREHVIPLSKGGTNEPSNIRPAHRACNSGKGNRELGGAGARENRRGRA